MSISKLLATDLAGLPAGEISVDQPFKPGATSLIPPCDCSGCCECTSCNCLCPCGTSCGSHCGG